MFFKYCLFCACILFVSASVLRDNNNQFRLDIIHYNDFHDRFEETSVDFPICKSNDSSCIGGFARLYYEIKALLQEKPNALVLDAGDTYQGTYWYTLLKWNVTQKFINMIPNDVHALGNHEFDDGILGLVPYIKALEAPVVAANLITPKGSDLHGLYKPHVIVKKNGKKIGIIGLITQKTQMSSRAEGVTFLYPIPVVKEEAQLLTDMKVDIIVVLSHCGLDVDIEIARLVGENIDVIVGGHTHSLLWNGTAPSNETVSGPYPLLVESETKPGHEVLIVTASAYTKYLGNLSVYFDQHGEMTGFDGVPVFLNRSIPEDPQMKALLQPYADSLHELVGEVIGFSTGDLKMDDCASKECALGNFIADGILNAANKKYLSNFTSVCFSQRGTVRGSIPKGAITRGALINVTPFTNQIVTFVIPGRYILEALGKSVKNPWTTKPYSGPYTPIVAGLKVKINTTSAQVVEALVKSGTIYKEVDPDKDYQLTTVDFLALVAFPNFKKYGRNFKSVGKDVDVIEDYIQTASPIRPYLDNRLTLVS